MHVQKDKMEGVVNEFFEKIKNKPDYYFEVFDVVEIAKNNDLWIDWPGKTGVYAFANEKEVFYVGRALKGTYLGKRIDENTKVTDDIKQSAWQETIKKPSTKIILCIFKNEKDDFWAASLEIYLFDHFLSESWKFNKRRG